MKLFEFTKYSGPTVKELDINDVIKLLKEKCQNSLKSWRNNELFRGDRIFNKKFYLGDMTNAEPRKSANTYNYYTLWMDNSPKWKDFPKRSKSFICSSDHVTSSGFDTNVAIVIPFDDAKIGVCPSDDLWSSFDELSDFTDLSDFMNFCRNIFDRHEYELPQTFEELKYATKITQKQIIDKCINDLLELKELNNHTNISSRELRDSLAKINCILEDRFTTNDLISFTPDKIKNQVKLSMDMKSDNTLADTFNRILNPKNFQHFSNGKYNIDHNKEVFIEGKCIFINPSKLSNGDRDRLETEFPELKL